MSEELENHGNEKETNAGEQTKKEKSLWKRHRKNEQIISKEEKHRTRRIKRKQKFRWVRRVLIGVVACLLVAVTVLAIKIYPTYRELAKTAYSKLMSIDETTFTRNGNTEIYDASGDLIGKIGNEKYIYADISEISPYITNGYIAQEDKNFYTHFGIDIKATARATYALIKNKGEITQGGSTITMQVVKNNLLSQERTYERKILEMMLALQIEKRYDKSRIMEFYCNTNYYGNGCYGVEGASQYYFGKSAKMLTLAEAAMLVGTSNSPNNYNPVVSYEKATAKKEEVLASMLADGMIKNQEYQKALKEKPKIVMYSENTVKENAMMTYAMHCVTLKMMNLAGIEMKYTFDSEQDYEDYKALYQAQYNETYEKVKVGGYKIYTSMRRDVQKKLQKSVDEGLKDFKSKKDGIYEMQGAAVCIDNNSQMVIAIVGGRNGKGSFNRGYQAKRQPGSAIKPLLDYAPAINEGVVIPSTIIKDKEVDYDGYKPQNAGKSYSGDVTVRTALTRSINTVAVQTYDMVGKETAMSYLGNMNFSSLTYTDQQVMSAAIGGLTLGVTVDDMARGYAILANDGEMEEDGCILKIVNNAGKNIYKHRSAKKRIFTDDTAFIMSDMLQGVFNESSGTAHKMKPDSQVYAGKTGTTNDMKDAWFCGYSEYYTTCVWTGYDTPKSVSGMYGSTYPLEIWSSFMEKMHAKLPKREFFPSATVLLTPNSENKTNPYSLKIKTKQITYKKDFYDSRPDGWDYISGEIMDDLIAAENKRQQENEYAKLEEQVEQFEELVVTDLAGAEKAKADYTALIEKAKKVEDVNDRTALTERLSYKYDLLEDEVFNKWDDIKVFRNEYGILNGEQNSALAAQKSAEATEKEYKKRLTENMNWYIKELQKRTLYTDSIEDLISDGEDCLETCKDLDNYLELSAKFEQAKMYARSLPAQIYEGEMPLVPDSDNYTDSKSPDSSQEYEGENQ